jgi:hypothetical protein
MLKWTALGVVVTCAPLVMSSPVLAGSADDPALSELVEILRAQGVLNDDQYHAVSAKAAAHDSASEEDWTDRIEAWGDFRSRFEMADFENNRANSQRNASGDRVLDDQERFRYRLRFNVKGHVNDHADVFFRLATGRDGRTTNETLGAKVDFNTDEIFLDKAYARVSPFAEGKLPDQDGTLQFYFGRTEQPWRWDSVFKDWLLWDDELSPAGAYGEGKMQLSERLQLFANAGAFYIDENSTSKDPKLIHGQLGLHGEIDQRFDAGARATWFNLSSLDGSFISRGIGFGNTGCSTSAAACSAPGLTGDRNGGSADVLEFGVYAKARLIERWPMLVFADVSTNLDATGATVVNPATSLTPGTFRTSDDDLGWLIAFQIGDAKEIVRFRTHYAYLEANSFPGQFVDSDLFDGKTNRKGWVWDLTKRVMKNTDASVTAFLSDPIETSGGYDNSQAGAERFRLQANMVWSF